MARNRRNEPNSQLPILMSAAQMAKVSGIGENTLRRLMADNQIEYLQIGSHRLLAVEAIWEYCNRNKTPVVCCKHEDIHFGCRDQRAS